jgi:hypothetical protein
LNSPSVCSRDRRIYLENGRDRRVVDFHEAKLYGAHALLCGREVRLELRQRLDLIACAGDLEACGSRVRSGDVESERRVVLP